MAMALEDNSFVPIYKRPLPKEPKPKVKKDPYEFTDVAPQSKRREHRSSILFDKNTYEIMQKLEEKEAKEKRKRKRTVKPKKVKEIKTYDNIINNIMKKVKDKILRRKSNDDLKTQNQENLDFNENDNDNNGILPFLENETPPNQMSSDISNHFGFDEIETSPTNINKIHHKNRINIISDIIVKPQDRSIGSPRNFVTKRPNANSTMILDPQKNVQPKPWRVDLNPVRQSPLFVSVKSNALPNLDQDLVMDHTIVEDFEKSILTEKHVETKQQLTSVNKTLHQTSMLDFIESNIDKENEQLSLFDQEAFNSPEKNASKSRRLKHILGDATSTPVQRRVLSNIGNLQDIQLEESTELSISIWETPERVQKQDIIANQTSEEVVDKPMRFDVTKLRSYIRKKRVIFQDTAEEEQDEREKPETIVEDSTLTEKLSNDNSDDIEVHLFEESEDISNNMPTIDICIKKPRRKRLASCDSDIGDQAKKKAKKIKVDPEQEHWAADFNQMCEEVEHFELEIE